MENQLCEAKSKLTVRVASQEEGAEHKNGIDITGPSDDLMLIYLVALDGIGDGSTRARRSRPSSCKHAPIAARRPRRSPTSSPTGFLPPETDAPKGT
jgi:hypothetical protein